MDATQRQLLADNQTLLLQLLKTKLAAKDGASADVHGLVDALATLTQLAQVEEKNAQITEALRVDPPVVKVTDLQTVGLTVLRR